MEEAVRSKIDSPEVPHARSCQLHRRTPDREPTVTFLSGLLTGQQAERRTRKGRRALGSYRHAVLALRWFLDSTRTAQLATDNHLRLSTAYRYLHEAIDVLAATCAHTHDGLLDALTDWTDTEHTGLADLGYEGENTRLTCPIKKTRGATPTVEQRTINALHSATRALAERWNSLLKTTFKGLHRVTLCPWRIGAITAAALVLLHHEHDRTT